MVALAYLFAFKGSSHILGCAWSVDLCNFIFHNLAVSSTSTWNSWIEGTLKNIYFLNFKFELH